MTHDPRDSVDTRCPCCHGYGYIPDDNDEPENFSRCADCGGSGTFKAVA